MHLTEHPRAGFVHLVLGVQDVRQVRLGRHQDDAGCVGDIRLLEVLFRCNCVEIRYFVHLVIVGIQSGQLLVKRVFEIVNSVLGVTHGTEVLLYSNVLFRIRFRIWTSHRDDVDSQVLGLVGEINWQLCGSSLFAL